MVMFCKCRWCESTRIQINTKMSTTTRAKSKTRSTEQKHEWEHDHNKNFQRAWNGEREREILFCCVSFQFEFEFKSNVQMNACYTNTMAISLEKYVNNVSLTCIRNFAKKLKTSNSSFQFSAHLVGSDLIMEIVSIWNKDQWMRWNHPEWFLHSERETILTKTSHIDVTIFQWVS